MFFLGGEVRMHAGHDPILDVGEIWTYQGAATIDRPIVITDVFNGYGICGSSVNGTVYSAAYRNAARVDMMIADGFPFPVSGTATKPDGTMGQIYGDPHVVSSHWYVLVEHSGSLGDHGLGPMCSIAAGMRDIGAAADTEDRPAVQEPAPAVNNTGVSPGGVTIAVSKPLYSDGDTVRISGNITEPLPGYPPVSITLSSHAGTILEIGAPFNHPQPV